MLIDAVSREFNPKHIDVQRASQLVCSGAYWVSQRADKRMVYAKTDPYTKEKTRGAAQILPVAMAEEHKILGSRLLAGKVHSTHTRNLSASYLRAL